MLPPCLHTTLNVVRLVFQADVQAGDANAAGAVAAWAEENETAIRQFRAMIGRAQAHSPVAPAMLAQIASQARNLLGR